VSLEGSPVVRFQFDWQEIEARPGETIAVALLAAGVRALRTTDRGSEPRGIFCNMGVCFDCLVEVDGYPNVRACQTIVREGMQVRTQHGHKTKDWGVG
jgi:predicted molibdopterin-dependent oxidoreductase YjgC